MKEQWSGDLSYAFLRALYEQARSGRRVATISEAPEMVGAEEPALFVRHDVDMCLDQAARLAQREGRWGIRATYHVMLETPFYRAESTESRARLREIAAAGHEVGLHFYDGQGGDAPLSEDDVGDACDRLEQITGEPVASLSFHLPRKVVIRGPWRIAGRVNAYAEPLLRFYLSDSRGGFMEGDPRVSLANPRGPHLQLLVHPIWWAEEHEAPDVRLGRWAAAHARAIGDTFEAVAERAWDHIIVRATKP